MPLGEVLGGGHAGSVFLRGGSPRPTPRTWRPAPALFSLLALPSTENWLGALSQHCRPCGPSSPHCSVTDLSPAHVHVVTLWLSAPLDRALPCCPPPRLRGRVFLKMDLVILPSAFPRKHKLVKLCPFPHKTKNKPLRQSAPHGLRRSGRDSGHHAFQVLTYTRMSPSLCRLSPFLSDVTPILYERFAPFSLGFFLNLCFILFRFHFFVTSMCCGTVG